MKKILETFHVGSFLFLDWENDSFSTSKQSKSKSSIMSDPRFYSPLTMEIDLRDLPNLRSIMSGALIYNGMDM